jgi:hypothetical protein
MGKDSFSVTTKVPRDIPKEPHSKAFGAWSVSFCQTHPAITELEMVPIDTSLCRIYTFSHYHRDRGVRMSIDFNADEIFQLGIQIETNGK